MARILVIDDDAQLCRMLSGKAGKMGHLADCASTLSEGLRIVRQGMHDIVLLDVRMPDGNGLKALPEIREAANAPEVIIITGDSDLEGAEQAIKSGAWDYIKKTSSLSALELSLTRAIDYHAAKAGMNSVVVVDRCGIRGESSPIKHCMNSLAKAARSTANVLIAGETGTGKELFARAVHNNSHRSSEDFVVVDCAALPNNLVESVLFGHVKGAFTGATENAEGLVQKAHKGTLFLDEIGELPLSLQKAFLRILQEHRYRPVGSTKEKHSDFRLVAASNRNLEDMVAKKLFREDLLFRLNTFSIHLPLLKERKEDIIPIAMHHVAKMCKNQNVETKGFSPELIEALCNYDWPGNVRELLQALEKALASAHDDGILVPLHLPDSIRRHLTGARNGLSIEHDDPITAQTQSHMTGQFPKLQDARKSAIADFELQYLRDLMRISGGDVKKACRISGLAKSRLYDLMKLYGLFRKE